MSVEDDVARPIPTLGLRHIEAMKRRVDADDLVALAVALGANPNALLLPPTDSSLHLVEITGSRDLTAADAWSWARGERYLPRALSEIPPTVPAENRHTYAQADFENSTDPAVQNWTDQPNIVVVPQDIEE
ncbi:hypothetical protein [Nocardia sp. NPDC047038]|uniref:hypothetical protein n=1 Tax=Nocardia sp. NPDC047038 TaxID=3154338 RepID=UPI0033D4E1C6